MAKTDEKPLQNVHRPFWKAVRQITAICSVLGRATTRQKTCPQECSVFFIQLNKLYNKNKVLPPYVKLSLPQCGI